MARRVKAVMGLIKYWKRVRSEVVTNNSAGNDMMRRVDRKPFITPEIA